MNYYCILTYDLLLKILRSAPKGLCATRALSQVRSYIVGIQFYSLLVILTVFVDEENATAPFLH